MVDKKILNDLADQLYESLDTCVSISPLSSQHPELSIDDAYYIQMRNVERNQAEGKKISGKKIGLTSKPMQELLGVDEPDYGHLYDTMDMKNGKVNAKDFLQLKVEAEIAFILKEDVKGPNATIEDVLKATDYVTAALEIVDSRVKDWKIKLVDTVADNASSGCYVLGDKNISVDKLSLPEEEMVFYKNEEIVNTGKGDAVLGNPAFCVAWLANKLWDYGVTLKAGEVVLSGALSAAVPAEKGDTFRAEFSTLGTVSVEFI